MESTRDGRKLLKVQRIDSVGLVDTGANQASDIVFSKREDKEMSEKYPTITRIEKRANEIFLSDRKVTKEQALVDAMDENKADYPALQKEYRERAAEPVEAVPIAKHDAEDAAWQEIETMGKAQVVLSGDQISLPVGISKALRTPEGNAAYKKYLTAQRSRK